jgi:hypothetical protein
MVHGIWTKEELNKIREGKDRDLITEFLNEITFSSEAIKFYPYELRRTFNCFWSENDKELDGDPVIIYATDVKALKKYILANYTRLPDYVSESITHIKEITLK